MDTNDREQGNGLTIDRNAQINVVLNQSDSDDIEIDLVHIFQNMKATRRVYAWVIALCLFVGLCAPVIMQLYAKPELTVSSVVTLNYDSGNLLAAPDESELDLSRILSSYVLQNAMNGLKLSTPVPISSLRSNITIERILTEESRQVQELAAKMATDNNPDAIAQIQSVSLNYSNKFVVSLRNGFGKEDSRNLIYLTAEELRMTLDEILNAYNEYLVMTYSAVKLPDDELSVIDLDRLDVLESLSQMRAAADDLYTYCDEQPDEVKAYRSWKTGLSLNDWMLALQSDREVTVDYLYSYVYTNGIVKNKDSMLISYEYQLRNAQSELEAMNKNIETVNAILQNYKKDSIFVSMQESDTAKSTSTATDYYNDLILSQAENYRKVANMETNISTLTDTIEVLRASTEDTISLIDTEEEIDQELRKTLDSSISFFNQVKAHMEEVRQSPQFTNLIIHTAAQGDLPGLLKSSMKNIIIGVAAGAVVGCGLWFMSALLSEFSRIGSLTDKKKEAEA